MTCCLPSGLPRVPIPGRLLRSGLDRGVRGAALMVNAAAATAVATAGGAALRGGDVLGRSVRDVRGSVEAAARVTAAVARETVGGRPARRVSANGPRFWIEVRGLRTALGPSIGARVVASLRGTDGVESAFLIQRIQRVVVTVEAGGPGIAALCALVADAERASGLTGRQSAAPPLPGDDSVLIARVAAAALAAASLGASVTAAAMRVPGLPDWTAVPATVLDHVPQLRREVEKRIGVDGADLLLVTLNAAASAMTVAPATAAAEAALRAMLAVEAWNGRVSWARHEPELCREWPTADHPPLHRKPWPAHGAGEHYANRAVATGVVGASALGMLARSVKFAATATLISVPKPMRAGREAFGCAVSRGLASSHDALVIRPRALRTLDRVDAVVVDPRMLYTDGLVVSRVRGVSNGRRGEVWAAAQAALDGGNLHPGWHRLTEIPGAGSDGEVLVSPLRDPLATAVIAEARKSRHRVVSLDDDGLRSLAQGFDELRVVEGSIDEALTAAIADLRSHGATVAFLTADGAQAAHAADLTIGLARPERPPPWGADVMVTDLAAAWRLLHAMPAARRVTDKGIQASVSSSFVGALMMIPGVPGTPTVSVNLGVAATLWSGFRAGMSVFRTAVPLPEPGQDWHALTGAEVQRLLPRPLQAAENDSPAQQNRIVRAPCVGRLADRVTASVRYGRDFVDEMRADLDDPITPILATGAVASALLGSPLDAVLVGGVLLVNAALSSQQQLHAERVLHRLLAVQDPLARRRVGALDEHRHERVAADRLRPGDIVEIRSGEVVPADGRVLSAVDVEVDESQLTGESLPVTKQIDPTPGVPLAERACMVYAGSTVVAGTAVVVVTAAGPTTELRRAMAMSPSRTREIGLQRQLRRITGRALPWSLTGGGLVGALSVVRGTPLRESVASAVSLIVAAVPEGLPLVVTLAQLAAARRLTARSVLVRNPRSVEALARLDVVCFDKTGTLTENRLEVKAVRPVDDFTVEAVLDAAVRTTYARHNHRVEHATDEAVKHAAEDPKWRAHGWQRSEHPSRDAYLPFQSGRPFAAALVGDRLTIKGAPEALSQALTGGAARIAPMIDSMAAQGLRVLAVAQRRLSPDEAAAAVADPSEFERLCADHLDPVGLLGLADTPRPASPWVLSELDRLGVGVRLITGDHPVTALAAAGELGLEVAADQVITGSDWQTMTADERAEAVDARRVFARMTPEQKVEVVQTLEKSGRVTAMVGDGANDAAAIRAASVGVGVASRGSDPARTAADVVLLDGCIEAFLDAVDEGQQLWRRVQSAVSMLLGGNAGEVCFALLTSLLTGRSALNARQMLLVNMLTDALPASALAVSTQTSSADVDFDEAALWRAIGVRGATTTLGASLAWVMASMTGTPRRAGTVALISLVSSQLAQTLVDSHGRLVVLTAVGSFAVLVVVVNTPGVSQVFGCTPVGPVGWGQALLATGVAGSLRVLAPAMISTARTFYSSTTSMPARSKSA